MTTAKNVPPLGRPEDAPPLRTDADVLARVEALVGAAAAPSTLWLLLVDGDDRQSPVVMPIHDVAHRPDGTVDALATVLAGVVDDLATPAGPGSVILVRERLGAPTATDDDRTWGDALAAMCDRTGVAVRGVFASTPRGVVRLR